MNEPHIESELKFLREENERLRRERDLARKDRLETEMFCETESSVRLRLLAESLSREVKERFLGSIKNALWAATLLIGIATAGGLWKLSDIVTTRVDEKIKEKEQDVAQVRQQIINSVVDFERQANKSLDDIAKLRTQVAMESDQATGEIRQAKARILSLEISSQGEKVTISASAPGGASALTWFGNISGNATAVAGSQANEYGSDDSRTQSGAFSFRFQHALQDVSADANSDGRISIAEAAAATRTALIRDHFNQTPTVAGQANDAALFSTTRISAGSAIYKSVHAVVVGINKYMQTGSDLLGPANDAKGFVKILGSKERSLFGTPSITLLTDEQATTANINNAVAMLRSETAQDDLVIFYFSGHVATIDKENSNARKIIFPTDGDFQNGRYIRVSDVVDKLSKIGAKHSLVIIDG